MLAAIPAFSQVHDGLGIRIGPPPPPQEVVVVRPYPDAVWIAGYYEWLPARGVYVWTPGRWVRPPRRGAIWVAPRWQRHRGEYVYYPGRWR